MRLFLIIGLLYVLYRIFLKPMNDRVRGAFQPPTDAVDDIMVKDPYCETYFSKRDGVHLRLQGKDYYFCSIACRDHFIALHDKKT